MEEPVQALTLNCHLNKNLSSVVLVEKHRECGKSTHKTLHRIALGVFLSTDQPSRDATTEVSAVSSNSTGFKRNSFPSGCGEEKAKGGRFTSV